MYIWLNENVHLNVQKAEVPTDAVMCLRKNLFSAQMALSKEPLRNILMELPSPQWTVPFLAQQLISLFVINFFIIREIIHCICPFVSGTCVVYILSLFALSTWIYCTPRVHLCDAHCVWNGKILVYLIVSHGHHWRLLFASGILFAFIPSNTSNSEQRKLTLGWVNYSLMLTTGYLQYICTHSFPNS